MCGINGLVTAHNKDLKRTLEKMNGRIIHRGPDEDGFFLKEDSPLAIGMAMRRLSIIDLNTGQQPIHSEDSKITIVFNGEIYNFIGLRDDLRKKGYSFHTTSDTEVILRLYECYGTSAFSKLDGMFAFSIYDDHLKKIFICRDFFGEKPLYYMREGSNFVWASELKSLMSVRSLPVKISQVGLNLYFQLTYIPSPFTIYEDIFKLRANHYLEFDVSKNTFDVHEINQAVSSDSFSGTFDEAKKITHDMVQESVSSRSISDVPLGTFLSGGVDSSIVSLCLAEQSDQKIDTFSIGFEKKSFDETDKSRTVANLIKSNHHEFIISEGDLKENLDNVILNFDEPFADSSSLATYLVAAKTREHVKVALTGDGGDEVFGGYNKYYMGGLNKRYSAVVPEFLHNGFNKLIAPVLATKDDNRGVRFRTKRLLNAINYSGDFYYNIISLGFQEEELKKILCSNSYLTDSLDFFKNEVGENNKSLKDFRNIDRIMSLEGDMLVKVDRTSMLTSLETRAPFLNKKLWNFASSLPEKYLLNGWNKKYILKESFKEYFPENFLEKSKQGFGVPVGDWLRGHLKSELKKYSQTEFLVKQNIFEPNEVSTLIENHIREKEDNTFKVWTFFCFQKWYVGNFEKIN